LVGRRFGSWHPRRLPVGKREKGIGGRGFLMRSEEAIIGARVRVGEGSVRRGHRGRGGGGCSAAEPHPIHRWFAMMAAGA
jgi:hypothetical protein